MKQAIHGVKLYRNILKLHRNLPPHQRIMGDNYVREEFQKHKNLPSDSPFLIGFIKEWNEYLNQMQIELEKNKASGSHKIIKPSSQELEKFSHEQIDTLYELYQETQKPRLN